jgi:hypothetical protein
MCEFGLVYNVTGGFVAETAKPSARESAGGFAFVPLRAAWGDIVGLSKNGVPPLRLFYGGKMQNCRRRVASLVALRNPFGLRTQAATSSCTSALAGGAMLCFSPQLLAIC